MPRVKEKSKPKPSATTGKGRSKKTSLEASLNGHAEAIEAKVKAFDAAAQVKALRDAEARARTKRLEEINALPVKQRVAAIMAEQLTLQHGISTEKWQELAAVQVEIAMRVDNAFGESTRAYLALLEAKKIDMGVAAKVGDWLAAANQASGGDGQVNRDNQLTSSEVAELAARMAEQAPAIDDRPSHAGRLVVGEAVGGDDRPGRPDQPGRPLAARSIAGLDQQLADLRLKAIG